MGVRRRRWRWAAALALLILLSLTAAYGSLSSAGAPQGKNPRKYTATFVGAKEKGVPGGIAVDGDGKLRSRVTLEAVEGVSRSDFFVSNGASYVNAGGKVYQVSNKVVCYNTTTKVWFTGDDPLYQIRAYSDDLTIYVDPYGEKVRVITTQ